MVLSLASRLSPPAFSTSTESSATAFSDCWRRFSLIRACSSRVSCSLRVMRSISRSRWLVPISCSRLLPASSRRRCTNRALSAACSASSRSRCSGLLVLPFFSRPLMTCKRIWLLLISAWARSGRVCAVMIRLLASLSAACQAASWLARSLSSSSSCAAVEFFNCGEIGLGGLALSLASSRRASLICRGASSN